MADLLLGLAHLIQHRYFQISTHTGTTQQIPVGQQFESYCKDWLSLIPPGHTQNRAQNYGSAFCYEGSANNPPDAMYRGGNDGDAFEFKKFEQQPSAIPLNSSYPKDTLHATSPSISIACRGCEHWTTRTLYYVVGAIPQQSQRISSMWVVDGALLAATNNYYENIFNSIQSNINTLAQSLGATTSQSRELGRLTGIDPLRNTTMRCRAMWELKSPSNVFGGLAGVQDVPSNSPVSVLHALILDCKWSKYPATSQAALNGLIGTKGFNMTRAVALPDPNNPTNTLSATLIRFQA
jgi:hypothetical protein